MSTGKVLEKNSEETKESVVKPSTSQREQMRKRSPSPSNSVMYSDESRNEKRDRFQSCTQQQVEESLLFRRPVDDKNIGNQLHSNQENPNERITDSSSSVISESTDGTLEHQFPPIIERGSSVCSTEVSYGSATSSSLQTQTKPISYDMMEEHLSCRNCQRPIFLNEELRMSLVKETRRLSTSDIDPARTFTDFYCRICDRRLREGFAKHHLINHETAKELYYCLKCQKQINYISIEPFRKPAKRQVIKEDSFSPLIETKTVELQGVAPPDSSIQPHCRKCGKIFDYIGPLIHKILDCNVHVYKTTDGSISAIGSYVCCLCEKSDNSLLTMQSHASQHVERGDVICKICHEESKRGKQEDNA